MVYFNENSIYNFEPKSSVMWVIYASIMNYKRIGQDDLGCPGDETWFICLTGDITNIMNTC